MKDVKTCSKCKVEKPLSEFFARKGASDGKMSSCKACKTAATYAWREKCADKFAAYMAEYQTRPHAIEARRAARSTDAYRAASRIRDAKRRKTSEYRQRAAKYERSERVAAYRRAYKNRADSKARARELSKRDHFKERHRISIARARSTVMGGLNARMSCAINRSVKKNFVSWRSVIGYSLPELKAHLEKQFLPGMSWENFGAWHIDHIIPISSFKFHSHRCAEFQECWSLSNLRPLWAEANLRKSDKRLFLL